MREPKRAHMGRVLNLTPSYDVNSASQPVTAQRRRLISFGSDLVIKIWNFDAIGDKQFTLSPFQSVSETVSTPYTTSPPKNARFADNRLTRINVACLLLQIAAFVLVADCGDGQLH